MTSTLNSRSRRNDEQTKEDRGQVLDQSEDKFLRDRRETLSVTFEDFHQAQNHSVSARRLCEAAGVVISASGITDS